MPAWCASTWATSHIPQAYAQPINAFYQETFNPWLNLHRPCLFATSITNAKGKIVKRYRHEDVKTPLECLTQLAANHLVTFKPGISLAALTGYRPSRKPIWPPPRPCNGQARTVRQLRQNPGGEPDAHAYTPHCRASLARQRLLRNPSAGCPAGSKP